jgi:hypothetical protein
MRFLGGKGEYFEKLSKGSKTYDMTSEGLGEVFKGDSADMCTRKFPLDGGQANGQACAEGERGPPSARAEMFSTLLILKEFLPTRYIQTWKYIFKVKSVAYYHDAATMTLNNDSSVEAL